MKSPFRLVFLLFLLPFTGAGQMIFHNNYSVEYLAQRVLASGCVEVLNITYNGDPTAAGYFFRQDPSAFPFASGVILATGASNDAQGPNNSEGAGTDLGLPGDADLTALSGVPTFDATILEFDFVPSDDTVEFQYIFASEEYNEYVCAQVNDVFGFFLSGPGISGTFSNGAINVALIPNTTTPVSINSVNNGTVGANGAAANCISLGNAAYYVDNAGDNFIQYDGRTVVMTARLLVTACQTYHLKLAIADGGDGVFDSGVFLLAGSFGQPVVPTMQNFASVGEPNQVYEGCEDYYVFHRPEGYPFNLPVNINLAFGGTGQNGVDITPFPSQVVIPGYQNTDTVYYSGIIDDVAEPGEYIIFMLDGACPCNYSPIRDTIWIIDNYHLGAGIVENDTVLCATSPVYFTIHSYIPQGINPQTISYHWSTGSFGSSIYKSPPLGQATSYILTVTDLCGQMAVDTITYTISNFSGLNVTTTDNVCAGAHHGKVTVVPQLGFPPYTYVWSSGANGSPTNGVISNLAAGTYGVTVYDAVGCQQFANFVIDEPPVLFASYMSSAATCNGYSDGSASIEAFGGVPPYDFQWSNGATGTAVTGIPAGNYSVTVTDQNDCTLVYPIPVSQPDPLVLVTPPNPYICLGQQAEMTVSAYGGTGPYYFFWSNGMVGPTVTIGPLETSVYSVYAQDLHTCITDPKNIIVNIYPPITAELVTANDTICRGESATIYAHIHGGTGGPYTAWFNDGVSTRILPPPYVVSPKVTTTFSIYVEDFCGSPVGTAILTVFVFNAPVIDVTMDVNQGCSPLTVNFQEKGGQGVDYKWNFGDGTNPILSLSQNPWHQYINPGTYSVSVTVTSDQGCVGTMSLPDAITVFPNPEAGFTVNPPIASILKPIIYFQNQTPGENSYFWDFGDGETESNSVSPEHAFHWVNEYTIMMVALNQFGCRDTSFGKVSIKEQFSFYAPNAFCPRSTQGENRVFRIVGLGIDPASFHLVIYDRWGGKVFESFDPDHPWDGRQNGEPLPGGSVYPWVAIYRDYYGTEHKMTGSVTIVD